MPITRTIAGIEVQEDDSTMYGTDSDIGTSTDDPKSQHAPHSSDVKPRCPVCTWQSTWIVVVVCFGDTGYIIIITEDFIPSFVKNNA